MSTYIRDRRNEYSRVADRKVPAPISVKLPELGLNESAESAERERSCRGCTRGSFGGDKFFDRIDLIRANGRASRPIKLSETGHSRNTAVSIFVIALSRFEQLSELARIDSIDSFRTVKRQ